MASFFVRAKANLVGTVSANLPKCPCVFPSSPVQIESSLVGFAGSMKKTVAYRWHDSLALESSSNSIINSFWLAPICSHTFESIALMSVEMFGSFLHDGDKLLCGDHLFVISRCKHIFYYHEATLTMLDDLCARRLFDVVIDQFCDDVSVMLKLAERYAKPETYFLGLSNPTA